MNSHLKILSCNFLGIGGSPSPTQTFGCLAVFSTCGIIRLIIDPDAAEDALPIADATLMTAEVVIGAPLALLLNAGRIGRANDGGTLPRTKPVIKKETK